MFDQKEINWYVKRGLAPPRHTDHVKDDELAEKMRPLKPHAWRLEGNKLIAKTDMGELVNYIPPNYILTGTNDQGLPTFKKI